MSVETDVGVGHGGTLMDHTEAAEDFESTTTTRLNELHVKAGSARLQQYAGKLLRRIINQHNIWTVNSYTLTNILKEKSEHLWLCLMCEEDDLTTKLNLTIYIFLPFS
jgi:hypothetical protein